MDGFVHSSRKADDEGQNIADDKGRFEIAALHFLHLKHNGIRQAGDNGKKIAEHAAGGDLIKEKDKFEVQTFQTAMKSYMRSSDKELTKLLSYAYKLNMKDEIMKYIEVMI